MKYRILFFSSFLFPFSAFAQINTFRDLLTAIGSLISLLIPLAFGLALLFFLWGLAQFIFKAGDETAVEVGKRRMLWGVIALFVISSIWGIVSFFQADILGLPSGIINNPGTTNPG